MTLETRIFLESHSAGLPMVGGHLYLVKRIVDVQPDGTYLNVYRPVDEENIERDQIIRGTSDVSVGVPLVVESKPLADALYDQYSAGETPEVKHSVDITRQILDGGGFSDVESAWNVMRKYALGINQSHYDYELPDAIDNHDSNSNAVVLSVLNKVGLDVRTIRNAEGTQSYTSSYFIIQFPGASEAYEPTLLGMVDPNDAKASKKIEASANQKSGLRILGRDTVDDYMIGTKFSDAFFGEQEAAATATFDTVSNERASTGLNIRLEKTWAFPYTPSGLQEAIAVYGVNEGQDELNPDVLWGVEKIVLSKHADVFAPTDETLKLPIWIDMGEPFTIDPQKPDIENRKFDTSDYDKLTFENLSTGVALVNGAIGEASPNGPLPTGKDALKYFDDLVRFGPKEIAEKLFWSTQKGETLRVTGAENITLTSHDDVVMFADFGQNSNPEKQWGAVANSPRYGDIDAGAGNDIVYVKGAEYVGVGEKVGKAPTEGEDNRPVAAQELRMTVLGGAGDDRLLAVGGRGAILKGGAGSDFLFSTSYSSELYGGDGVTDDGAKDIFWYSPGVFIKDAGKEDVLYYYGLPLTGGWNGAVGNQTKWASDWANPLVRYARSSSDQLIIETRLEGVRNHVLRPSGSNGVLSSAMIVEKYDFGAWANWAHLEAGDLGMTFRITVHSENGMGGFQSLWGALIQQLDGLNDYGKQLRWLSADDPLVLDLDGDGIETSAKDQGGVHFDFNGDDFAELSGWVGADDGFLVLDRDGDGKIDDISELFGAPGGSGFAELRLLDGDSDGVIDAGDVAFDQLQVWRDLNQDGLSQSGELFSLADLGITSLDAIGAAFGVTTPSGALLREKAGFTRADGTRGDIYEAIFETTPLDTLYTGDRGVASYAARGVDGRAFDGKGFGRLADLGVALSNDIALGETVGAVAAAMTAPDLKTLRAQVAPVLEQWGASLAGTRELTPLLLSADGKTVNDRAIWIEDAQGGYFALCARRVRRRKIKARYWVRRDAPRSRRQRAKMPQNQRLTKATVRVGCVGAANCGLEKRMGLDGIVK